jgi:hypothetical protein
MTKQQKTLLNRRQTPVHSSLLFSSNLLSSSVSNANLCFGGKKRNRLFMCVSTSVYSLYVDVQGALLP